MHLAPISGVPRLAAALLLTALLTGTGLAAPSAATTAATAAAPSAARSAAPAADEWLYRVQPGDTLIDVARRHFGPGNDWHALQRLNGVKNPRRLMPDSTLRLPVGWLRRDPASAEVIHVYGDVRLLIGAAAAVPLAVGARVQPGAVLECGPQSSATLRFVDGSRVLVVPDSRVRIEHMLSHRDSGVVDTRLRLERGGAESRVVSQRGRARGYEVLTPTVNLGVRGTEFRAHVATDASRVEVLEGLVAAEAAGSVLVGAGFGAVAAAGQPQMLAQPLVSAPDLAAVPALVERVPLRLSWTPVAGAVAYRAQVFPPADNDRLLLDGRFAQATARWADLPDGRYELRVRAVDAAGLEGVDGRASFVLKARPEPPFYQSPAPGAKLHGDALTLRWTLASQAARYRLQVSTLADFASLAAEPAEQGGNELTLALPPGDYHWRVASVTADGDRGPFGDVQTFTLRPIPQSPTVQAPEIGDNELVVRWRAARAGESFELQLARDTAFADVVHEASTREAAAVLPRPEAGRYYLRVRAVDADGFTGPWGSTQTIDVPRSNLWLLVPVGIMLLLLAL